MAGIDWDFISEIEGESTHKTGYVPAKGSGFTVGSFDIGQHSAEDIRRIIQSYQNKLGKTYPLAETTELYKIISPYTLREDVSDEEARKISFEEEEIKYLTAAKRYEFELKLRSDSFNKDFPEWKKLDDKTKTVLSSVGWQFGTGEDSPFRELYKLRDDKNALVKELNRMGEGEHTYRRGREAKYVTPSEESSYMEQWNKEDNIFA